MGQKQTLDRCTLMPALPPKADIRRHECDVRFVPQADILSNGCLSISDPGLTCGQLISFREHTHRKSEIFFCHYSRHHPA
jgi:hypothetical protein